MTETSRFVQPAPIRSGENVPKMFRKWAAKHGHNDAAILSFERDAFGQEKYGQPLMSNDGRDTIKDIEDEVGDALHYITKAKMQGLTMDLYFIKEHLKVCIELIDTPLPSDDA